MGTKKRKSRGVWKWADEELFVSARKYEARAEWRRNAYGAYQAARRRGPKFLAKCTKHMTRLYNERKWTLERCMDSAGQFGNRRDWERSENAAVMSARKYGYWGQCTAHMETVYRPIDAVYLWRSDQTFNFLPVYKVGIAVYDTAEQRIRQCANAQGFEYEVLAIGRVGESCARDLERQLLELGTDPQYTDGTGYSEFRAMTDDQAEHAVAVIMETVGI